MDRATVDDLASGFHEDPTRSMSLRAAAYTEQRWADADLAAIFARTRPIRVFSLNNR